MMPSSRNKRCVSKKVQGDEIEIEDPAKPGVTTKVNTKEVDIDTDDQGNVQVKAKDPNKQNNGQSSKSRCQSQHGRRY